MDRSNHEHWTLWQRNVIDEYKDLSEEEIKLKIKENSLPFSLCLQNWSGDFNVAAAIRSGNSFGANKIFYVGKKKIDRRATVGVLHYSDVRHFSTVEELVCLKQQYTFVAIENNVASVEMTNFVWPTKLPPMIIMGEENSGITSDLLSLADYVVSIPSRGSVRSMNCAAAAAVAMWDYTSKYLTSK